MKFYTYLWLREDCTPYYVGKGQGHRCFSKNHRVHKPADEVRIIVQDFEIEEDAFFAEKFLIEYYGRLDIGTESLSNLTEGGEGFSGLVFSEEHRKKLSISKLGKPSTKKGKPGHKQSEETRRKISLSLKGKFVSEDTRRKLSLAYKGVRAEKPEPKPRRTKQSIETRIKISKSLIGNKRSPGWPKGKLRKLKD